jgi:hypothetical protein
MARRQRKEIENWKRGLIAGSAALSVICFFKRRPTGGLIFGGVALAALVSEYPEKVAEIRARLPEYAERGIALLDFASLIGERLAEAADRQSSAYEDRLNR